MADPGTPRPRPTLRDIARSLGVSHVTVSLALHDSPRVSEARRIEIKAMAEKIGYRPDPMLASLAAYRLSRRPVGIQACLGWINQWDPPEDLKKLKEFDNYWLGAKEAAESFGYRLEEFCWPLGKPGRRLQTILQTRGVRGLLIPPHRFGVDIPDFDWSQFSIVRFGASAATLPVHAVTSDQGKCTRMAFRKALELGYPRIGYVSDAHCERSTDGHFREGYLNAQDESLPRGLHLSPLVFATGPDERAERVKALRLWIKKHKPAAIITSLPELGPLMQELGLRIPEDIAVATTSVLDGRFSAGADQNSHEIGRVASCTLSGLIMGNERGIPRYQRRILVEGRWVDGSSMPRRK